MKQLFKLTFIIFISITTSTSCVSMHYAKLNNSVTIITDEFESLVTITGISLNPPQEQKHYSEMSKYFIRSFVDKKTKSKTHQVYVSYKYYNYSSGWRFYDFASLKGGESLNVVSINRDVQCNGACGYTEVFGIDISDKYLRNHQNGFPMKVSSKSSIDFVLKITAQQIKEQLKAVDSII